MAVISLSYDTNEKKVTCSVDGKEVEDMCYFCLCQYDDSPSLEISFEPKRENGVTTYTRVIASENSKPYQKVSKFSEDNTLVVLEKRDNLGDLMSKWVSLNK